MSVIRSGLRVPAQQHAVRAVAAIVLCATMVTTPTSAGWFDAATGKPVYTIPLSSDPENPTANDYGLTGDKNHAKVGSKSLYYDKACGTWRDAKTGREVYTIPLSSDPKNLRANDFGLTGDKNHATVGNKNLFWKPCPPPEEAPAAPVKARPHVSFGFGIGTDDNSDDSIDGPRAIITFGK